MFDKLLFKLEISILMISKFTHKLLDSSIGLQKSFVWPFYFWLSVHLSNHVLEILIVSLKKWCIFMPHTGQGWAKRPIIDLYIRGFALLKEYFHQRLLLLCGTKCTLHFVPCLKLLSISTYRVKYAELNIEIQIPPIRKAIKLHRKQTSAFLFIAEVWDLERARYLGPSFLL